MTSKKKKYPKDIRISIEEDVHAKLVALAERRGEPMVDIIRPALYQLLEEQAAKESIDLVNESIRKAVNSALKPFENRIAAMTAKSTIASATTMYTNHRLMQRNGLVDQEIIAIHEESRKKAVSYLKMDMKDM